ncbi:BspA family leucine-rich repeat surface protein [Segatella copri]|uniref:BspA family leucine-rich repeat surface protein n=1 Tax=Segatella copri TaxID=165179 RepID=UPI003F6F0675
MSYMFSSCKSLTSLDVTKFDTRNVTTMEGMFSSCSKLPSLDVTNFNTVNVKNMMKMFAGCKALTSLDVTNFNSENVTNMNRMFYKCSKLTSLDVSNFNTKKVTNMSFMFSYCSTLTTIYVNDKFVIDKVTNGSYMFDNCTNLKGFIDNKNNSDKTDHIFANYKTGYFTKLVGKNGDEKIGATGEPLATDNLVLDDDKDFVAYEPFAAKAASYSRKMKEGTTWATLCLPFEVSLADKNFRAFKLLSADDVTETVELEEIEGSIAIIKMKDGATKLSISEADKTIAKDVQTAETADVNYQLQGIYTKKEFSKDTDNNCYIVKGDKLMNPAKLLDKTKTESVGSKPFRAYMVDNSSAPAAGARMFSISVGGSTTAIEQLESTADSKAEYYDLQGRRLQNLQKGVNIVKHGGKTMKVIIK